MLGGVPKIVLADRMGCLKAGVVANVVVPTADYVRFATHYGFRPDFCHAADPESKGIVENLVGYSKRDLMIPEQPSLANLSAANTAAAAWCARGQHRGAFGDLRGPGRTARAGTPAAGSVAVAAAARSGRKPISRKVDKLSCVRFGSARYSVPNRLIGTIVLITVPTGGSRFWRASPARSSPSTAGRTGRDQHRRRALRLGPAGQAAPRATSTHSGRATVPRPRRDRRTVPGRRRGGRGEQAAHRAVRDPHPARRARSRRADRRVDPGGRVRSLAR